MIRFTTTLLIFLLISPALIFAVEIKKPRYFEQLPQSRIDEELAYLKKHQRWSQRVVIEIIAHGIIGSVVTDEEARIRNPDSIGMFQDPKTGEFEFFNKKHSLGWKHNELDYKNDKESICTLRGITCGGVENTTSKKREDWDRFQKDRITEITPAEACWCVSKADVQSYTWPKDADSENERCIQQCIERSADITYPKKRVPLDAIVAIDLSGKGLVGSMIPSEVSSLPFLKTIDIGRNRLSGTLKLKHPYLKHLLVSDNNVIGLSFENMWSLDLLDLRHTGIGGTIPDNLLKVMPKLSYLDFSDNAFVGTIPLDVWNMPKLQTLDLRNNQLTGPIPSELIRLPSLERLILGTNQFTSFPYQDWPSSKQFKEIIFNNNQLTGTIPLEMFQPSLEHLELSSNKLKGPIPKEIETCRDLRHLDLATNKISGTVPLELYKLSRLKVLRLHENQLQGQLMDSICENGLVVNYRQNTMPPCKNMVMCPRGYFHPQGHATPDEDCAACAPCHTDDLMDKSCLFIGQTTCEDGSLAVNGDFNGDGQLSEREILRLMFLNMNGERWNDEYFPWTDIKNYPDACVLLGITCRDSMVTEIRLQNVGLGPGKNDDGLLHQIGLLRNLLALDLSQNDIKIIPAEIGNLNIVHLFCWECGLNTIHPAIWTIDSLEALNLSTNEFINQIIPPDIGRLTKLTDLKMHRCGLVGSIPAELPKNLRNLDIYGNNLEGVLPETMKSLNDIYRIDIYNNQLRGSIAPLTHLPNLQILHAKQNRFSGTIPSQFSPKLTWLDLTENMFVGTVPRALGQLPNLKDLHLGNNKIFGIPTSLCNSDSINDGSTGNCDHILCPMDTFSHYGYAKKDVAVCEPCPEEYSTMFLGSTACSIQTGAEYIDLFMSLVKGVAPGKGEEFYDECDLEGVACDEKYNVESIEFSLSNLEFDEKLFTGIS